MILNARFLDNVSDVNNYNVSTSPIIEFTEGDSLNVYIQLTDLTKDKQSDPPGRRYVPAAGSTLSVVIENIDDAKKITRTCSMFDALDGSIWTFAILPTDLIRGTSTMRLVLNENGKVTYGKVLGAFRVQSQTAIQPYPASNLNPILP
jgi:hypothetical protein